MKLKEALYYEKLDGGKVACNLCPHHCRIGIGGKGICKARQNIDGRLFSMNYGKIASIALDPIEKKPLRHFHPGSLILSAGTFGCNLKCSFCQNWSISQEETRTVDLRPEVLVGKALEAGSSGSIGIAYTYNEPSIWFEYVLECSIHAKKAGLKNVLVTNGFIEEKPLIELLTYIDAMNIDVKAFTEAFYNKICKGSLEAVKKTVEIAASKCHVEITTLLIPGVNDAPDEIEKLAIWLSGISKDIVLHFSRFFPNYMMKDVPPTPRDVIINAKNIAQRYLNYVYTGNM